MTIVHRAPVVTHLEWGKIGSDDRFFRDIKLWPGGAREWDWRETGTRHSPGIQLADCEELLEHGAEIVVLSRGMQLVLQVSDETVAALTQRGVEVMVEETKRAAERYNELARAGRSVAALLHSTC